MRLLIAHPADPMPFRLACVLDGIPLQAAPTLLRQSAENLRARGGADNFATACTYDELADKASGLYHTIMERDGYLYDVNGDVEVRLSEVGDAGACELCDGSGYHDHGPCVCTI